MDCKKNNKKTLTYTGQGSYERATSIFAPYCVFASLEIAGCLQISPIRQDKCISSIPIPLATNNRKYLRALIPI